MIAYDITAAALPHTAVVIWVTITSMNELFIYCAHTW